MLSHCDLSSQTMKAYLPLLIIFTFLAVEGKWIANPTTLQSVDKGIPKIRNLVRISLIEQVSLNEEKDFWQEFLKNVNNTLKKVLLKPYGRIL